MPLPCLVGSLWLYLQDAQQQEGMDLTAGWSPWQQLMSQPVLYDSRSRQPQAALEKKLALAGSVGEKNALGVCVSMGGPLPSSHHLSPSLVLRWGFVLCWGCLFSSRLFPRYIPCAGHRAHTDSALKGIQPRKGSSLTVRESQSAKMDGRMAGV